MNTSQEAEAKEAIRDSIAALGYQIAELYKLQPESFDEMACALCDTNPAMARAYWKLSDLWDAFDSFDETETLQSSGKTWRF
jgi:hypothetical protein